MVTKTLPFGALFNFFPISLTLSPSVDWFVCYSVVGIVSQFQYSTVHSSEVRRCCTGICYVKLLLLNVMLEFCSFSFLALSHIKAFGYSFPTLSCAR